MNRHLIYPEQPNLQHNRLTAGLASTTPALRRKQPLPPYPRREHDHLSTTPSQRRPRYQDTTALPRYAPTTAGFNRQFSAGWRRLKRSSRPSLDESRPLKVTVKAVVSREGILLDSAVVKSSGLDRIDQEAMALVQRAFPMQLDRTLDRGQIAMRIPITYSQRVVYSIRLLTVRSVSDGSC